MNKLTLSNYGDLSPLVPIVKGERRQPETVRSKK